MLTNLEHLAEIAYEEFHNSEPAQKWEVLPESEKKKWRAAVRIVVQLNGGILT